MENNETSEKSQTKFKEFTIIPNKIIDEFHFSPHEFSFLAVLLRHDYQNKETKQTKGYSYPSITTIKKKTRMSTRKIYECIYVLSKIGFLRIEKRIEVKKMELKAS